MHLSRWSCGWRDCHKLMSIRLSLNCGLVLLVVLGAGSAAHAADLVDYGAYLSGECTSCHRPGATPSDIPSLDGLSPDQIVEALHEYQSGQRTNPVMVAVARSLNEEQTAALAAFFSAAKTKPARPARR